MGGGKPVVLVGASFGGPITRYFTAGHRGLVAGLVLVDPSGDDQTARFAAVVPSSSRTAPSGEGHRACIALLEKSWPAQGTREFQQCLGFSPADAPAALLDHALRERGPSAHRTALAELTYFEDGTDARQGASVRKSLGDLPLIVLSGTPTFEPELTAQEKAALIKLWRTMHWEDAQLSTQGRRRFVEGAGHNIQIDKPDDVIAAVVDVVTEARSRESAQR